MIYIATGFTGTTYPLTHGRVCWQWQSGGTVTATTEAARFLGLNGEGLIRSGARADLLLVEGDPLADISALRRQAGVVVNGRWLPSADIERMLVNG
jgi:N-acyl-D-aspartate/D-glutamate deacylase